MTHIPTDRPTVELLGQNGNAFNVLGLCQQAARRAGWAPQQIEAFRQETISSDYVHLLGTVIKYFDVQEAILDISRASE